MIFIILIFCILIFIMLFVEYFNILVFFIVALIFCIILCLVSWLCDIFLFSSLRDFEKISAYECGFQPFSDARSSFDIRFYLVAILFIIFDLEVTFLLPWSVCFQSLTDFGFWNMYFFLFILTIGFYYEWIKGALEWH